jgi:hypothetical protein
MFAAWHMLLTVCIHLFATCMAIGVIVMTDMRLLAKLAGYRVVIPPPERFETRMISVAMTTLVLSGVALVMMELAEKADLSGQSQAAGQDPARRSARGGRIRAPLREFPASGQRAAGVLVEAARPPERGTAGGLVEQAVVVLRVPRHRAALELHEVDRRRAGDRVLLFAVASSIVMIALRFAARDEPQRDPDWIDSMKARLSDCMPLGERHGYGRAHSQDTLF